LESVIKQLDALNALFGISEADVAQALRQRWREIFARRLFVATGQWVLEGFDWHNFSNGLPAEART
jgi:hypothetical protein